MVILDSNVWIAFFHANDSQHEKACKIFSSISTRIVLPEYILIEVASVLAQKAAKSIANMFLARVLDNAAIEVLIVDDEHFLSFCKSYREMESSHLSFIDGVLLALSSRYTVVTFDKHLKKTISRS